MSDFSILSPPSSSILTSPLSGHPSGVLRQLHSGSFSKVLHKGAFAILSVLFCFVVGANGAAAADKITNVLSKKGSEPLQTAASHAGHSHHFNDPHQSDMNSLQSSNPFLVQASFQQRGNDRRGRANNRTRSERAAQRGQRSRANRSNRNTNRGNANRGNRNNRGTAQNRSNRGQNGNRRSGADRNPNRGQSARPQNRRQDNRGQRARNGNRGQQGVAPRNRDRRVDQGRRRAQNGQNNNRRNDGVRRGDRRRNGVRSGDGRRRGNRGAHQGRHHDQGFRGNGRRRDHGFRNSRRAHKNGVRRSHRRSKRFHNNRGFRHTGYNGFHRSGFALLPFTGVRYGHGLRSHHRGGHGYFCSDHSVFHYFLGFDPLGFTRISAYGRSNYRYSNECYPVEKVGYHRGRKAILEAILCYDSFNYPYIKKGSTYVVEYY